MVAKAATRSGEFFCFHCGKSVEKDDRQCKNCGIEFDRIIESFRCPRCSNLLPVGAVACPSCNLGFKIKTVESTEKMSSDDKFLMKLIEWGEKDKKAPSQPPGKTVRVVRSPPPPPPLDEEGATMSSSPVKPSATVTISLASDTRAKRESMESSSLRMQAPKKQLPASVTARTHVAQPIPKGRSETGIRPGKPVKRETILIEPERKPDVQQLIAQLEEEARERDRLETEIRELRAMMQRQKSSPEEVAEQDTGLSSQVLKRLLEERDREIMELKAREEELARREEHLNRKIRMYSIKMKELQAARKEAGQPSKDILSETGKPYETQLIDEKEKWIKDQTKIKAGLIEIRNQMISAKDTGQVNYYPSPPSGELLEKIEVLEEKLADANKEREELREQIRKFEESRKDVSTLLKLLDQLLGKLPPEIIDKFSKSENFRLYEKVLDDLNI